MVYVDSNPIKMGRSNYWRVFAASQDELLAALDAADVHRSAVIDTGLPSEHALVSTSQKDALPDARDIDMRGLVKLIKRKRSAVAPVGSEDSASEEPVEELKFEDVDTVEEDEEMLVSEEDDEPEPEPEEKPSRGRGRGRGRLTIKTKD